MTKAHVARQPIFKAKNKLYAYELLFRDGPSNAFPMTDGDTATSRLLHHTFFSFDFDQLTAGAYGFVNFTRELIVRRVPLMFPPERLVVEILESVPADKAVLDACQELVAAGYRLVLDDFVLGAGQEPLVELASMIKIDMRQTPPAEIARIIAETRRPGIEFVAEKVETYVELLAATDAGCTCFQGYYFSRPEVMSTGDVSPNKLTLLELIHEVNKADLAIDQIAQIVSRDVSLTYKLLRYINSAFFQRQRRFESVRQAIIYLGEREIRQFVSLVATAKLSASKPEELVRLSIARARACDALRQLLPADRWDGTELFLLGLLSALDAIMDRPMDVLMRALPLSPALKMALAERKGPLADCLELVVAYEQGRWQDFATHARALGIDEQAYPPIHLDALAWARTFMTLPD